MSDMESRRKTEVMFNRQHGVQQVETEKNNILTVCRLAIKDLIDTACLEPIHEDSPILQNFCIIMEHILSNRLKPHQTWYGVNEPRTFWDYIRHTCRLMPHTCLRSVHSLEYPKTSRGKSRAWIRMALMEKRLAEYLTTAVQQIKATQTFYQDGAVMLSDEIHTLCATLMGLNAIDFNFDLRGQQLDYQAIPVIDYTPYMKFEQSPESQREDSDEQVRLERLSQSLEDENEVFESNEDYLKARCFKLDKNFKHIAEQKGYLEELVRLRDVQLQELQRRYNRTVDTMRHLEMDSHRDRRQLENVVIELQAQISAMKEDRRSRRYQAQMQGIRYDPRRQAVSQVVLQPEVRIEDLSMLSDLTSSAAAERHGRLSTDSSLSPHPFRKPSQVDTRSIMSGSSNISFTREETQSMVPLAGSFTSETNEGPSLMMMGQAVMATEASANDGSDNITAAVIIPDDQLAPQEASGVVLDCNPPTNEKPLCVEISQSEDLREMPPCDMTTSSIVDMGDRDEEADGDVAMGNGKDAQHELEVAMAEEASAMPTDYSEPALPTTEQSHSDASDGDQQDFEIVENNGCA